MKFFHLMRHYNFIGRRCSVLSLFGGWLLLSLSRQPFRFIIFVEKP